MPGLLAEYKCHGPCGGGFEPEGEGRRHPVHRFLRNFYGVELEYLRGVYCNLQRGTKFHSNQRRVGVTSSIQRHSHKFAIHIGVKLVMANGKRSSDEYVENRLEACPHSGGSANI